MCRRCGIIQISQQDTIKTIDILYMKENREEERSLPSAQGRKNWDLKTYPDLWLESNGKHTTSYSISAGRSFRSLY